MSTSQGERSSFAEIVRECKLRIMRNEMASELNVLARDAARVANQNPVTADFTRNVLRRAIRDVVACFPVYRTYVRRRVPTEEDRRDLNGPSSRRALLKPKSIPAYLTSFAGCCPEN